MKFSFIVNPISRNGNEKFRTYRDLIERHGYDFEVFFTERRGHATELVKKIKGDVVLIAGGDGTLNEVVNGVKKYSMDVYIAPLFGGTGCDVARSLGVKRDPEERLKEILDLKVKRVNPISLKNEEGLRLFVGVSDLGFGALVAKSFDGLRSFGRFGYAVGVFKALYQLKSLNMDLEIDGKRISGEFIMIVYANSPFFGGGMKISPNSSITSKSPRIITIRGVPKTKFVYYFPRVYFGRHLSIGEVEEFEARILIVNTPGIPIECEGEHVGNTPVVYELVEDFEVKFV